MELSIILINHNTKKLVTQTVNSILSTLKQVEYEVIVADNSDDEKERFKSDDERVKIMKIPNRGFSKGCNTAAKEALGTYLLFLNSDSILKENTVDESFKYIAKHQDIGVLGVKQQLQNGKLDHGCKRGFPTPMASLYYFLGLDKCLPNSKKFGAYRQTFVDENSITDVDSISGAYILLKKDFFESLGGFDEDYFMYGEDVDLCYRIKEAGKRVVYYGKVSFIHIKGQSGINNMNVLNHFYKSMRIFYDKHYKQKYSALTTRLVYLGIKAKHYIAKQKLKKKVN